MNVISLGNSALLFNGVNGCLDEIPNKLAEALKSGDIERLHDLSQGDVDTLVKRGHLTSLSPDLELVRFKEFSVALHQKREKEVKDGGIMLLMSYNCNLACKYCYQQEHRPHKAKAVMSLGLLESLFEKHLAQITKGVDHKRFSISFYGGEPFLPSNESGNSPLNRPSLGHFKAAICITGNTP